MTTRGATGLIAETILTASSDVANSLEGIDTTGYVEGTSCYVQENYGTYCLYPDDVQAADDSTVVAAAGGGNWILQRRGGPTARLDPSQLTANANNWSLAVGGIEAVYADSDAARDVTGIVAVGGARFLFINDGAQNIVLKHENANSDAANRFLNDTGADITMGANAIVEIFYDLTATRWRVNS